MPDRPDSISWMKARMLEVFDESRRAALATEARNLVDRWLGVGDSADLDTFDDYLHQDVVVHAPLGLSTMGLEAERDVWRAALDAIPDLRHAVQEVVIEGNTIAVRVIVTGTSPTPRP